MDSESISVVLCTRDRPALLKSALEVLAAQTLAPAEVIVVDSASTDPAVATIAREAGATVLRCERAGLARARNLGWRAASTELIAFFDDDGEPDPGWLAALVEAFAQSEQPAFVTGAVAEGAAPEGRAQVSLSVTSPGERRVFAGAVDFEEIGHGANIAWRKSVLQRLGGFDEELGVGSDFPASEDTDTFARALDMGLVGLYTPDAVIAHQQWRSRRQVLRQCFGYGKGMGAFAVKRWRQGPELPTGPVSARAAAKALMVDDLGTKLIEALKRGHQMGAISDAYRMVGAVIGAAKARRYQVIDGHLRPPGS